MWVFILPKVCIIGIWWSPFLTVSGDDSPRPPRRWGAAALTAWRGDHQTLMRAFIHLASFAGCTHQPCCCLLCSTVATCQRQNYIRNHRCVLPVISVLFFRHVWQTHAPAYPKHKRCFQVSTLLGYLELWGIVCTVLCIWWAKHYTTIGHSCSWYFWYLRLQKNVLTTSSETLLARDGCRSA